MLLTKSQSFTAAASLIREKKPGRLLAGWLAKNQIKN